MSKTPKNKIDYVAWGLDDATPGNIDESMAERQRIFKRISRSLDRMAFLLLVSTVAQVALIYTIYTQF